MIAVAVTAVGAVWTRRRGLRRLGRRLLRPLPMLVARWALLLRSLRPLLLLLWLLRLLWLLLVLLLRLL